MRAIGSPSLAQGGCYSSTHPNLLSYKSVALNVKILAREMFKIVSDLQCSHVENSLAVPQKLNHGITCNLPILSLDI